MERTGKSDAGEAPVLTIRDEIAWVSLARGHPSNMRPLQHSFSADEAQLEVATDCRMRNEAGEPLSANCFPEQIFGAPHAEEKDYQLPHLFFAGSFWVVSVKAAEVLRQFDLGSGALYPVEVLKCDRETPIGGEWLCINFGNVKRSFLADQSRRIDTWPGGRWLALATAGDGDLAVDSTSLQGPAIWIEPSVCDAIFLSGPLGAALKKAKADKGFFLKKCRVI